MRRRNPDEAQFDDFERRDLLHGGRAAYGFGFLLGTLVYLDLFSP
jgi:hypothetical protein